MREGPKPKVADLGSVTSFLSNSQILVFVLFVIWLVPTNLWENTWDNLCWCSGLIYIKRNYVKISEILKDARAFFCVVLFVVVDVCFGVFCFYMPCHSSLKISQRQGRVSHVVSRRYLESQFSLLVDTWKQTGETSISDTFNFALRLPGGLGSV